MDPTSLLPVPDPIPAPAILFHILEVALFTVHILLINIVLGGSLLLAYSRITGRTSTSPVFSAIARKIPVGFALGINMGVAPLLFLQVTHGHLFYTSSILMAMFWIIIIPLLIIAYYAAYIHARSSTAGLATAGIVVSSAILLYIGFIFVNNILMMMQPGTWAAYFGNRNGTLLMLSDPTLIPRYLHFLLASIAVAGLASSTIWTVRSKHGVAESEGSIRNGLRIFGYATIIQAAIGLWFLFALEREIMLQFMGGNLPATIIFGIGFLSALGAIATSFAGNYRATMSMAAITMLAMIITRDQLRAMYLNGVFDASTLQVVPQYGVLALFLLILVLGLAAVVWMIRAGFRPSTGRTAS